MPAAPRAAARCGARPPGERRAPAGARAGDDGSRASGRYAAARASRPAAAGDAAAPTRPRHRACATAAASASARDAAARPPREHRAPAPTATAHLPAAGRRRADRAPRRDRSARGRGAPRHRWRPRGGSARGARAAARQHRQHRQKIQDRRRDGGQREAREPAQPGGRLPSPHPWRPPPDLTPARDAAGSRRGPPGPPRCRPSGGWRPGCGIRIRARGRPTPR